jgi:uncharacterized OB-fold protein
MHSSTPSYIWRQSQVMSRYPGPARLVTWSEVRAPLVSHEAYAPYIIAIVRLADGSRRTAQIVDCIAAQLTAGLDLTPTFRRIYDTGSKAPVVYGYKFTPTQQ